jgi:hypothetical protein
MDYIIKLIGCDDVTQFIVRLNDHEYDLLNKIAEQSQKVSTCSCMPKMKLIKLEVVNT